MKSIGFAAIGLSFLLLFTFYAPYSFASPQVCHPYSSNSSTSSDGSMFVKASTFSCYPKYDGQISWEAYSGQSYYFTNHQVTVCGNTYTISGNSYDLIAGQALYSTTCQGYYGANYATGQLLSNTFPAGSVSVVTSVSGWSGNCNTIGSSSPCTASASAHDP